jgi:beta-carotene hydroxylase
VERPPLESLGADLLHTSRLRLAVALGSPFACIGLYWIFALNGWWLPAFLALMGLSFVSYGSTSHDLVHRNLGLPPHVNDAFLSVIEGLCLRSGHAYRISHLHHHASFPGPDDQEGSPAHRSLLLVLLEGPIYVPRLWLWSWGRAGEAERRWILVESFWVAGVLLAAVLSFHTLPALALYCGLIVAGTWVFPLALVYLQHDAGGRSELFQTRAYRGRIIPALLLHHLYHLEHHLYPKVPAHHWHTLSRRLEPFLVTSGVKLIRIP